MIAVAAVRAQENGEIEHVLGNAPEFSDGRSARSRALRARPQTGHKK